jgi:hypothetical protein
MQCDNKAEQLNFTCDQVRHQSSAAVDGTSNAARQPHDAPRAVAQAADAVQRGVNACTVVTSKLTNLQQLRTMRQKHEGNDEHAGQCMWLPN